MVDDPRKRTKVFLDTYLTAANMTEDDDVTEATTHVMYSGTKSPLKLVFFGTKNNDGLFTVGTPTSVAITDFDGSIIGYNEEVPITISTVDKTGITGEFLRWKMEAELRLEVETYWQGSFRSLKRMTPKSVDMGGWWLYQVEYLLTYERSKGDVETHVSGITLSYGHGFLDDFTTLYAPTIYTATSNGAADGTTIINTAHTQANDYWNKRKVKMLTGTCAGEEKLISDFDAGTDTLTLTGLGFSAQIDAGDMYQISNWAQTDDATITSAISSHENGDHLCLSIICAQANDYTYLSYYNESTATDNLSLSTTTYPKLMFRYRTALVSGTSVKAKIEAVFSDASTQTVLDATAATAWTYGSVTLTAAKTLDHIRLYAVGTAGDETGNVYYDFVCVYQGDFPIPNCRYGRKPVIPIKNSELEIFGMSGNQGQNGGTGLMEITHGCDVTKGTWTRTLPADTIVGQVFHDIAQNSKSEPWQWYAYTTYPNMKVNLTEVEFPEMASNTQQDWRLNFTVREKRVSDAGVTSETYITRW